jgi:hypothetical protein
MAVFPAGAHRNGPEVQDGVLQRWPVFAVALLLLLIASLPGLGRGADLWRSLQPSGSSADTPFVAKREPLRALAALERRDGQPGTPWTGADGMIAPAAWALLEPGIARATAVLSRALPYRTSFWPSPLPRAPPRVL